MRNSYFCFTDEEAITWLGYVLDSKSFGKQMAELEFKLGLSDPKPELLRSIFYDFLRAIKSWLQLLSRWFKKNQ